MEIVEIIVMIILGYLGLGFLFSIYFVSVGVSKVDPAAKGSGIGFKLIIIPGVLVFWPMFLIRIAKGISEPPQEQTAHKNKAGASS